MLYFFNLRGRDIYIPDHEGEVASSEDVRAIALENAREMLRTSGLSVRSWLDLSYEVSTREGATILSLPFTEALDVRLP